MKSRLVIASLFAASITVTLAFAAPAPTSAPASATAPAGRPGGRGGRGGGGAPLSDADKADLAKLADYAPWKPGAPAGNYFIGPDYAPAPEQTAKPGVPKGKVQTFTINAADSKFYPDTGLRGATATRQITVYIPSQYVPGTPAPVIVSCDAYGARNNQLPTILDNMIADKRLPAIVAIMIANGGGDGGGSERGLEYDTVSGKYAEFVEAEIIPKVEKDYNVSITKDPDGRMTLGGSSGGSAAFCMAWFHPEWYHRALIYSGTFVNQHPDKDYPHGAWELPDHVIAQQTPNKPLHLWLEVGERDNGATAASLGYHNWLIANIHMADVLKAKGYDYQLVYAKTPATPTPKPSPRPTPKRWRSCGRTTRKSRPSSRVAPGLETPDGSFAEETLMIDRDRSILAALKNLDPASEISRLLNFAKSNRSP